MIKLVSGFLNSVGNKHTLTIKDPNTDLSPAEIKESLELLTTLTIFEKDGVGLFQKVVSAKYVETIETPIFSGDELFSEEHAPIVLNQSMFPHPVPAPVVDLPAASIEEPSVAEIDAEKVAELKKRSTYQAIPAVPQVSLDQQKKGITAPPETPNVLEESTESLSETPSTSNYRISEILRRRRNRRKAQEKQKKNPD
ncbi:DUF2922 domain-containing protein [Enterococcus sp. 669A]|uniref:DUF2922 domain-containing protein n=1 Tax=Candidatus Enterococcus moelleringii TaxID=2815325 RepID=A0ABS3L9H5_9ENTE|nr:DUF2922 domain-containing protein [Enterococcus sp. 669A]MBO1306299.1 DUF2922 domain-containing protein [Enterococcus sp. 669A]